MFPAPPGAPPGSMTTLGGIIAADPKSPGWRRRLQMASFKQAPFYVDQQGRSSGRRTVLHQYPKRDMPYAEDMGREAMRYQMTGYLIMAPNWIVSSSYGGYAASRHYSNDQVSMLSNYDQARDLLESSLAASTPGKLIDPYNPRLALTGYVGQGPLLFMCERYTIVEQREKGGFCSLEMSFVEAGIPGSTYTTSDTVGGVNTAADAASAAAADNLNENQAIANDPGNWPPPMTVLPSSPQIRR
jgi:hypothetical protein